MGNGPSSSSLPLNDRALPLESTVDQPIKPSRSVLNPAFSHPLMFYIPVELTNLEEQFYVN